MILQVGFFDYEVSGGSAVNHGDGVENGILEAVWGGEDVVFIVYWVAVFRVGGDESCRYIEMVIWEIGKRLIAECSN